METDCQLPNVLNMASNVGEILADVQNIIRYHYLAYLIAVKTILFSSIVIFLRLIHGAGKRRQVGNILKQT